MTRQRAHQRSLLTVTVHGKPIGEWYRMPTNELAALVTIVIPGGCDPHEYVRRILEPSRAQYHFTMTDESQALVIEQQKRTIADLEVKIRQLRDRKYNRDDEYIVRLHKSDSQRLAGRAGGLSLRQCQHCHALVVEDFLLAHEDRCASFVKSRIDTRP